MDVNPGVQSSKGGSVISSFFLLGRLYTRIHIHRRLYLDDFLVTLAWILLLINTAIWQRVARYLYELMNVQAGLTPISPEFVSHVHTYLAHSIPVIILFYTGLWAVKLSFLVFFRRLGNMVRGQNIHWWSVFVFTVVTWIITFGTIQYDCLTGSLPFVVKHCASGSAVRFQRMTLLYNMAMDVVTDAAIITIPVHLLWNVRISLKQKLMLMGIFSLTVIIMIFAIVRASVITTYSNRPDATWLYLWSSIEQSVSVLTACLASFRSLFTRYDAARRADSFRLGSWSPKPWFGRVSDFFTTSRYRPSSSSVSNTEDDMVLMKTRHASIVADDSVRRLDNTGPQRGIRVTRTTTNISYPRLQR